ncbi:hypothetical protein ERO13_D09G146950v2 [Gossypium hirsutum]|nr:hypothetical protein ERO13_D09G146950v2 [Gossypium hirsutum]
MLINLPMSLGNSTRSLHPCNVNACKLYNVHREFGNLLIEVFERFKFRRCFKLPISFGNSLIFLYPAKESTRKLDFINKSCISTLLTYGQPEEDFTFRKRLDYNAEDLQEILQPKGGRHIF